MSQPSVLYDTLGPKGRRNVRIGTAVGVVVIVGIVAWVLWRDRVGTRIRQFFLEGREQYAASGGRLT